MAKTQALKAPEANSSGPRRAAFGDKSNVAKNVPIGAKGVKANIDMKVNAVSVQQTKKPVQTSRQPLRPSGSSIAVPPKNHASRAGVKKIDVYEDKKKKSPERAAAIVSALARTQEQAKPAGPRRLIGKKQEDIPQFSDAVQQPYDKDDVSEDEGSEEDYDEEQENKYKTSELVSDEEVSQDEDDEEDGYSTARSRPSDTTNVTAALAVPRMSKADIQKLEAAKKQYAGLEDEDETYDIRMVTEYGDEIFAYMQELEVRVLLKVPGLF